MGVHTHSNSYGTTDEAPHKRRASRHRRSFGGAFDRHLDLIVGRYLTAEAHDVVHSWKPLHDLREEDERRKPEQERRRQEKPKQCFSISVPTTVCILKEIKSFDLK